MKEFKVDKIADKEGTDHYFIKDKSILLPVKSKDIEEKEGELYTTLDREQIIKTASVYYGQFLDALGFDWKTHPHMKDTPRRVTKSWIDDLSRGLFSEMPRMTSFENDGFYKGMVLQRNIEVYSMCAHHCLPFMGKAHVGYIPGDKIIGLSKLNRIVDYLSRKPTVQETLTQQIHDFVNEICEGNGGVAVVLRAEHTCVSCRGIGQDSNMVTSVLSGEFYDDDKTRQELFMSINLPNPS